MALGALPESIVRLLLARSLLITLAGVVTGVAAAFGLTRLLKSYLFEVSPTDPVTFAGVALVFPGQIKLSDHHFPA